MKKPPKKYTDQDIENIRRLYCDEGLTYRQVAERLGFPRKTVEGIGLRHGFSRNNKPKKEVWKDDGKFTCNICGERKPLKCLVEDRRYPPFPKYCCNTCYR